MSASINLSLLKLCLIVLTLFTSWMINASSLPEPVFLMAPAKVMPGQSFTLTIAPQSNATHYDIYHNGNFLKRIIESSTSHLLWGEGVKNYQAKACNQNGCGEFGNQALVFVKRIQPQSPQITPPDFGVVGEELCISFEEQISATRYYLKKNGNQTLAQPSQSPVCITRNEEGLDNYWLVACNNHGCSTNNYYYPIPIVAKATNAVSSDTPHTQVDALLTKGVRFTVTFSGQGKAGQGKGHPQI